MEESALCLERESQTVLQGDVVLHWRQCSRRALQRRSWSLVCVLPHSSMLRYNSQLSGMRSRSFNHILSNAAYISQADVFFQGWKLAKRNVKKKKNQELTCAGVEMCWEEPTGFLLVEPFGSQEALWSRASIRKKRQSKRDLVLF